MVQHRRAEPVPGYGVAVGAPVGALGGWLCLVAAGRHESAAAGVEFGYLIEPCAPHEKPPTILCPYTTFYPDSIGSIPSFPQHNSPAGSIFSW